MPELTLPVPVAVRATRATRAQFVAADAALTALVLTDAGLDVVPGLCVSRARAGGIDFLDPVRVRPVRGRAGTAWTVATSPGELRSALARAFAWDSHAWVEELADGRELELPVVRLRDGSCAVGAAHEVGPGTLFATERPAYDEHGFTPALGLGELDAARVRRTAVTAYEALELHGVACVSVVLDAPRVRVAALDAAPIVGPGSRVEAAFAAAGLPADAVRAAARGY